MGNAPLTGPEVVMRVKRLGLPAGEFVVVGSAVLAVHALRQAGDIDLVVSPELYQRLLAEGWHEKSFARSPGRPQAAFSGVFDASTSWSVNDYDPDPAQLIGQAQRIGDIPLVTLEELLAWKQACGRPKDLADAERIQSVLGPARPSPSRPDRVGT